MKRTRITAAVATGLATAMLLAACTGGQDANQPTPSTGDVTLKIGTSTEVVEWAPLNTVSITDSWITRQHFPALFFLNDKNETQPLVGKSFEVSADGKQLIIELNDNFKWSDGEPITAADVIFTLDRIKQDKLRAGASYIKNYESAVAEGDYKVVITMVSPSYSWALDVPRALSILPEHVYSDEASIAEYNMSEHKDEWVSGGSFVLKEIVPGQRYIFEPNKYWPLRAKGNERITQVEFNVYGDMNTMQLALRNGDIDLVAPVIPSSSLSSLSGTKGITIEETKDALNYSKLTFNVSRNNELSDPIVRRVISGLIDTEELLSTVLLGHGTSVLGPVLPIYKEYQPDIKRWSYTVAEAKSILKDAGYGELNFNIGCDQGNANHSKYAQIIRDRLAPAGINLQLACAERTVSLQTAKAKGFDLYIHKLNQANAPASSLFLQYHPSNPSGLQYNFFAEEPTLTALLDKANAALNEDDYKDAVKATAAYIHEEAYVLPLYVEALNIAYRGDRFTGFLPTGVETTTMVNSYSLSQIVPKS